MELESDTPSEREEIRGILADNIRALDDRVQAAREGELSPEDERLQLKRLRALAQLARQYRLLARDPDVDEVEMDADLWRQWLKEAEEG